MPDHPILIMIPGHHPLKLRDGNVTGAVHAAGNDLLNLGKLARCWTHWLGDTMDTTPRSHVQHTSPSQDTLTSQAHSINRV
jgi:hypothetical protein